MAEHPDITLVKCGYEAFGKGDVATLSELIAPDAVHHMFGASLVSGDYHGLDAILGFYGQLAELSDGSYAVEPEQFFADGNGTVIVVHRQTGKRNGKALDNRQALVFELRDGKIVDLHDTSDDVTIDDDFWS